MKNFKAYLVLPALVIGISKPVNAQQNSLFNTYSLDPLQLNIAYAGAGCTEANVHYRTQWIGLKESPKLIQLNAHTALGKSNALGLRVNSLSFGLLNTLQATLGYSYRFRIGEKAKMHLGVGVGWSQAALNGQKATVIDANDITLNNNSRQTANGFDSEFGAMVVGEKIKAGVAVLHLYNTNPDFSGSSTYKTLPQFNTQVSYIFNKGKKVEIEPCVLNRYTLNGTNVVEGVLNINLIKTITIGAGYRTNYGAIALVAAKLGNIKLAYSFDYGTTKNATNMGSSHQVMLGFSLCKTAKTPKVAEVSPSAETKEPVVTQPVEPKPEILKEEVVVKEEPKPVTPSKNELEEKVVLDMNLLAEDLVFPLGKSYLQGEALKKLDAVAEIMTKNPDMIVNIMGYTCNKGSGSVNNALSADRSGYVRDQLIKKGVKPENIKNTKGLGSDSPLFDNNSELQSKNRTIRFELSR